MNTEFTDVKDAIFFANNVISDEKWAMLSGFIGVDKSLTPQSLAAELVKAGDESRNLGGAIPERLAEFERARDQLQTPLFYRYVAGRLGLV